VDPDLQGSASNKNLDPHPDVRIRIKIYMLDPEPDSDPLRFADVKAKFMEYEPILALLPVFRIHDILVWIRSGSADPCLCLMDPDPGSGSCHFRHWPSRCQQKTNPKIKRQNSLKIVGFKIFLIIFAWLLKDPDPELDPDPYLCPVDPDPGGKKHVDPDPEHWHLQGFEPLYWN
jgi:hypothetical protein